MKEKKSQIVLILAFIAMITLPQAMFWVMNKEVLEVSTTENRKLNQKPEFKLATITEYSKEFEDYYNDHLPFRTELKQFWTNINYDIFHTTTDSRVILGNEEWFFYRGDKSIEQVQGILEYNDEQKENILHKVQQNINKFKEKGIDMYVMIVPNKENVYKEYLPSSIPIKSNISRTEELIDYIETNSDIKIVYPKQELLQAKEKYQIYKKYDTHWNGVGALIGTVALQKMIDPQFEYSHLDIIQTEKEEGKDLANFASLNKKVFEKKLEATNFYPEVTYKETTKEKYEEYISDSDNHKTVLFIGDSFRTSMKGYFSKLYNRVVYMHQRDYTKDLIEAIKPDIIVFETVERYSSRLEKELL